MKGRILVLISLTLFISCDVENCKEQNSNFIVEDVLDSHEWHFMTIGNKEVSIPLPIILISSNHDLDIFLSSNFHDEHGNVKIYRGYTLEDGKIVSVDGRKFVDLSITKNIACMWVSIIILMVILLHCSRWYKRKSYDTAPRGIVSAVEMLVTYIKNEIAIPNIGPKLYEKFMPYLLTVFFFIFLNNLIGLFPGAANVTGNITITLCLALLTFILMIKNSTMHYWKHTLLPDVPIFLMPIMIPIEIVGILTKPLTLTVRLFANVTSGHIVLLSIINLIFVFQSYYVGVGCIVLNGFMIVIKILVAFLQAYIFTLLSSIYFGDVSKE